MNIITLECPTWKEKETTAYKRVLLDMIKPVKAERMKMDGFLFLFFKVTLKIVT